MIVKPYKKNPRPPAIGLVREDGRVVMDDGTVNRLDRVLRPQPPTVKLYMDRDIARTRFLLRGKGKAICWNEIPIRWLPRLDQSVILLPGYPGDGEDVLAGLVAWRDFCAVHGAAIGSHSASAWSLLRATLDGELRTSRGVWSPETTPLFTDVIGGRQEAFVEPGHYGSFTLYDLEAAYARTLGELHYGGLWIEWDGLPDPDVDTPCLVEATVRLPKGGLDPAPIPRRLNRRWDPRKDPLTGQRPPREFPERGTLKGVWEVSEFRCALEAGAKATIKKVYLCVGPHQRPFERWWQVVQEGRQLPSLAGTFAKAAGNALWGRFAMGPGERTLVTYKDSRPITIEPQAMPSLPVHFRPLDVAELVTAKVRARLYREVIAPHRERLLSVHTDGALVSGPDDLALPPDWRAKTRGNRLVYINPQVYSYTTGGRRNYVVSGARSSDARMIFDVLSRLVLGSPATGSASDHARGLHNLIEAFPEFAEQIGATA